MKLDLSRLNLDAAARTIINAARAETVAVARDVEQGSRERAPELTSDLVNSHKTQIVASSASGITVAVSVGPVYSDSGDDYSLRMHEGLPGVYNLGPVSRQKNTGIPHHGTGVGLKFLERALLDSGTALARRIAAAIRRNVP
ncbi:hypothetical protein [Azospirillum thermophilum]|uniref:HK97 gp10 family phage protein n=1 Tax=Azospirillum thermophilum TaxID=2202148 RepID=A0A2S2CT50_9PROT|nr:hypothetical protein [Azospirillum thermophilum]AWK87656.1 hypothetical protein DEW08_16830 [Azospirillum thermophilum]